MTELLANLQKPTGKTPGFFAHRHLNSLSIEAILMSRHAAVLCLLTLCATISAQTINYAPPVLLSGAGNTVDVATADMNGDGLLDIISTDLAANVVSVFIATSATTFSPVVNYPSNSPVALDVGDTDGDGDIDVLVADFDGNAIHLLTNDGMGLLSPAATLSVGIGPGKVLLVDLDGDDDLDALTTNGTSGTVSVLTNDGSGALSLAFSLTAGIFPADVDALDTNADGLVDIVCTLSGSDSLLVFNALSPLNFAAPATYAVGTFPRGVAHGDFDSDGDLDLCVANQFSNTVTVLYNDGMGSYPTSIAITVGNGPIDVDVADLEHRFGNDIAVLHYNAGTIELHRNDGFGGFLPAGTLIAGVFPTGLAAADFDGDDNIDFAVANNVSPDLSLFIHQGSDVLYPGTGDDLVLGFGVNGAPTTGTGTYLFEARAGDALTLALTSPGGTYDFLPLIIAGQLHYRGFPPPNIMAGIWLNQFTFGAQFLVNGFAPVNGFIQILTPGGSVYSFTIPAGFEGLDFMVQGIMLSSMSNNGIAAFTEGHVLRFL